MALLGLALTSFAVLVQGQYFVYHASGLVVWSALLAVGTVQRTRARLRWPLVALIGWTAILFVTPASWRLAHQTWLYAATLGWALGLAVVQFIGRRHPALSRRRTNLWAAGLAVASLLATHTPFSAESLSLRTAGRTSWGNLVTLQRELADAQAVRDRIGADSEVAYLTFGDATYYVGNPMHCRYPSPLFLQRGQAHRLVSSATRQENLNCLSNPAARWLVWDQEWLRPSRMPADLRARIEHVWACADALRLGRYTVCPRRR